MTSVKIQSNKIVFNETKHNYALLESSHGRKKMNIMANPIIVNSKQIINIENVKLSNLQRKT